MSGKNLQALKRWVDLMVSFAEENPTEAHVGYKIDLSEK
jgi:hypothetical protein